MQVLISGTYFPTSGHILNCIPMNKYWIAWIWLAEVGKLQNCPFRQGRVRNDFLIWASKFLARLTL